MNILYDHQAISLHRYGGISRYFYEIANHIAAMEGSRVEVFAPLYVNEYFKGGGTVRPIGVYVPPIPKTLRIIRAINNFASLPLKMRRGVDIFHETYYSRSDFCPRSAKRIVTIHDMTHEKFPGLVSGNDETSGIKADAARRADHVICVSENTRKDVIELLRIPAENTSVVYHGYSLTSTVSSDMAPKPGEPYILYVGHRNRFRNVERLLRVYAASDTLRNHFKLIFFGGGGFTAAEQHMLKELSLSADTVMQMSGGDGVLAKMYSGASAFIYPSLYEGFGIPPLEAMSFGCPVVCSNISSIPEVVGEAAELFNPEDEADMGRALERVVSSPERTGELIRLGRERCKQFSWEKCARQTLDVYKQVILG